LAGTCNGESLAKEFNRVFHNNRTPRAIYAKASDLGIRLLQRNERYTLNEVSEMLGVWDKTVYMWIKNGKLAATKSGDPTLSHWNITRNDVRKFIIRYPTELTGRNVDMVQIVDILTEIPK
jgi:excisionase family DNA binding protein